jgi:hypothetical protein
LARTFRHHTWRWRSCSTQRPLLRRESAHGMRSGVPAHDGCSTWPRFADRTLPIYTSCTSLAATPAFSNAPTLKQRGSSAAKHRSGSTRAC